ncbi:MAG: ribosomal protein S18-alanine N-acetyltransferase [Candidatus Zixiibacteriota bacterium]
MRNSEKTKRLDFKLREMTATDIDAVMALEEEIFPDAWPRAAFEDILVEEAWSAVVAQNGDEIIGYGCYLVVLDEAHLANIAVGPAYRRKSVAKHILDHILKDIKKKKCRMLLLEVRVSNKSARIFYERYGFKELYRRKRYYRNPIEDALVMALPFIVDN